MLITTILYHLAMEANAIAQQLAAAALGHPHIAGEGGWQVVNGAKWWRAPFTHRVPLDPAMACDFTFEGQWLPSGSQVRGYHATKMAHLLNEAAYAPGSRGILNSGIMMNGQNGHQGDHGVFFHASPEGAAFYVQSSRKQWPAEPMCFVEMLAVSLKKVKGGMQGRYCALGRKGEYNRKVALAALWLVDADCHSQPAPPVNLRPPPPARADVITQTATPTPFSQGLEVVAAWEYKAQEMDELKTNLEGGYLNMFPGDALLVHSQAFPGHGGNIYSAYVYAELTRTHEKGWVPTLLLHQPGCGVAAYISGLVQSRDLNGQSGKIIGERQGRMIIALTGRRIAVPEDKLCILDDMDALMSFKERKALLQFHPDHGGDSSSFALAMWLRACHEV